MARAAIEVLTLRLSMSPGMPKGTWPGLQLLLRRLRVSARQVSHLLSFRCPKAPGMSQNPQVSEPGLVLQDQ